MTYIRVHAKNDEFIFVFSYKLTVCYNKNIRFERKVKFMLGRFSRLKLLVGEEAIEKLSCAKVCVFGVGGVGGYVVEALARSGVGNIVIVDDDKVALTNINRQIIATDETIGLDKVEVARKRILSINPDCNVEAIKCFYLPENKDQFDFSKYSYVVDCVDTVSAKLSIIVEAKANNIPVISAMGAGNKLNPQDLMVSDIFKTEVDPLARVMRQELKKRGIKKLKVVYSKEKPLEPIMDDETKAELAAEGAVDTRTGKPKRSIPGSTAFVPPVMGLIMASEIIKDLIKK